MKIKRALALFGIGCFSALALVGFSGCGEQASVATVKENYENLAATYQSYSDVFQHGTIDAIGTDYYIGYGDIIDKYIADGQAGFEELSSVYNVVFAISGQYIDKNKEYITRIEDSELTENGKKELTKLNKVLVDYTNSISNFVDARSDFISYFDTFSGEPSVNGASGAHLRRFKRAYGDLVSKNVSLANQMADTISTTEIFDILSAGPSGSQDTEIVKEFVRAKLLPIFSEFKITELENKLYWAAQNETETKLRIDNLIAVLEERFETFKQIFVRSSSYVNSLTAEEMKALITKIEDFFEEENSFLTALKAFNIEKLAIDYKNDLESYKSKNPFAEIYLEKMEQFVNITLDNFIIEIGNILV